MPSLGQQLVSQSDLLTDQGLNPQSMGWTQEIASSTQNLLGPWIQGEEKGEAFVSLFQMCYGTYSPE